MRQTLGILSLVLATGTFLAFTGCARITQLKGGRSAPQPQIEAGTFDLLTTGQSRLRLTTRTATAGILTSVFGPGAAPGTALIRGRILEFGGPCDRYLFSGGTPECQQASVRLGISVAISSESQATTLPQAGTGREALRTRACDLITTSDAAISFAALRAGTASIGRYPEENEIKSAYALFYPGRVPASPVVAALSDVVSEAKRLPGATPIEGWRYLLATLCLAADWQVL